MPDTLRGIQEIGNIEPLWKNTQAELPEVNGTESDLCWVCYWVLDFGIALNIANYHPSRKGSGWWEMNTLKKLPTPIVWMLADVPEKYYPGVEE